MATNSPLSTDERFSRIEIMRVSARIRPEFRTALTFFERLELCGLWALMECIEAGETDASIAKMFDAMKERMLKQAVTFRNAKALAPAFKDAFRG